MVGPISSVLKIFNGEVKGLCKSVCKLYSYKIATKHGLYNRRTRRRGRYYIHKSYGRCKNKVTITRGVTSPN
ncbi:unnamed protein product, partial [Brenthis ino]